MCGAGLNIGVEFTDYLILNCEFVFRPPNKLGLIQFKDYEWPSFGLCPWPENYPLKYRHENLWKESDMAPGTAAYAITPDGAKKMLMAVSLSFCIWNMSLIKVGCGLMTKLKTGQYTT